MSSLQRCEIGGFTNEVHYPTKKESKQSHCSTEWKLWILGNYEYAEDGLVFVNDVLKHSNEEKENFNKDLTRCTLGCLMKELFSEQVRLVQRGPKGNTQRAYLNLQRIQRTDRVSTSLSTSSLLLPNGWHFIKDGSDQISFIRHEGWELSNQRGIIELRVTQNTPSNITFKVNSHECSVDLKRDLGVEQLFNKMSFDRQILLAIQFIESSNVCLGFPLKESERVMTLVPHRTGVLESMTDGLQGKKVFAQNCLVLTSSPSKTCQNCLRVQSADKKCRKRKANNKTLSPYCNRRFLTKEEVEYQLKGEQMAKRNAEKREVFWREKFENEAVLIDEEDQQDLLQMAGPVKENNLPENLQCLWQQQQKILKTKSKNGYRWHPKIMQLCIQLYCKNPHVLDPLCNFIRLPSNRTIRYHKNKREQKPGWNTEIVEWCKQAAEDKNLKDCDYWGGFVIDEMKVEENLEMVVKGGKHRLVGYVDLGPLHDDMRALEGKKEFTLASHVLQFLFVSDCGFRFPVAQFPSHDCTPSDLFFQFWKGVRMMKEYSFTIYWTILDGADVNRKFIQMHFPDYEPVEKKFVAFNMHTGGPMVFMVDCKHNFKKIRNNIEKSNEAGKPRCLTVAGKRILWKHLTDAYKFDQTLTSIHIHEKLTEEHFQLDPALRMRNHLAEDVLDKRMHFLIKAYQRHLTNNGKDGSALDATIQMIDHTSSVIEFFSTSREAVMSKDDSRIRNLDSFIQFFFDWKEEATPKQFISSKLWFDLQSMVHGFKSVVNIKLTKFPNSVIRQWLVNQDGVENHFCQTRSCNGSNNNPTYRLQESSQNTIRFGQEGISSKCNAGISRA